MWDLPDGQVTVQRVLQYPVCLVVVAEDYARLGPTTGLAVRELSGSGWAAGAMLQPAAGSMALGGPVSITDSFVDLDAVPTIPAGELIGAVRTAMTPGPHGPQRRQAAVQALADAISTVGQPDAEGQLVNAIVEYVEGDGTVHRVTQIGEKFGLSERSLQRLTARRIGLSPKWLIQRRRLHEAAERLPAGTPSDLAALATGLGYADQAHTSPRAFRTVTGTTPGEFRAEPRGAHAPASG